MCHPGSLLQQQWTSRDPGLHSKRYGTMCLKPPEKADLHADDMNHWSSAVIADISMARCPKHSSCVRGMLGIEPTQLVALLQVTHSVHLGSKLLSCSDQILPCNALLRGSVNKACPSGIWCPVTLFVCLSL